MRPQAARCNGCSRAGTSPDAPATRCSSAICPASRPRACCSPGSGPRRAFRAGAGARRGPRRRRRCRARGSAVARWRSTARTRGSSTTTISAARSRSSPAPRSIGSTISKPGRSRRCRRSSACSQAPRLKPPLPELKRVLAGPVRRAAAAERGLTHGAAIAAAADVQRDLANLPANICTPSFLAAQARERARRAASLRVRVLDEAAIRREKMGCLLAVAQGSRQPPRFIVLEYRGTGAGQPPVVLVGKGVTFDSGGISLKDPPGMDEMKFDMSGAAAVLAALTLASQLKLRLHVVGLIAAVENMPGGKAVKPGDIATSASGQTVEILNTDAEGRLILCDALNYARRFEPAAVVDIATLTGACVVALGHHHSGVMGNDEPLVRELLDAGVRADDRCWQLPLTEEYAEALKSNFADFANVGGRDGGAITAATFLSKFTQGLKWAHLDVAGTAYQGGA